VAESLKADPQLPDLQHAKRTGVSDKTVTSVRRELETDSEIPNEVTRINARGQERPASYVTAPPLPASLREIGMSTRAIAAATGNSRRTIQADAQDVAQIAPPAPITGTDGKTYTPRTTTHQEDHEVNTTPAAPGRPTGPSGPQI
jgi:hypothetical protein